MNKMKFLFATICCLFVVGSAKAQFSTSPFQVYYDGSETYPAIVKIQVNTNSNSLLRTYNAAGAPLLANSMQSFSISIYKHNTTAQPGPMMGPIEWTQYNWISNALQVNQPYSIYLDEHNGQVWYLYIEKLQSGVRFRIGN
jgi:hypothetical protein